MPLSGQQCHIRSCDQTITGRRLSYARALEIVQSEEYLMEADRSVIRRRKKRAVWREALAKRRDLILNVSSTTLASSSHRIS